MNPGTQIPAQCPTYIWVCGTGPAQAMGGQPAHNTGYGVCYTHPHGECMQPAAAAQPQQNTLATICTQYGCPPPAGGAQPQLNTAFTTCTQPVVCQPHHNVSVPPHCPTVAPMCPPQTNTLAGGGQAQGGAYTVDCPPAAQPNANVSVPPHCPTVAPMCPPPAQAQNQQGGSFTQRPDQCMTGTTPAAGQQGQAQGMPETVFCQPATQHVVGCTTIAGYTHNPPMCPPVIHNPFTQHPYQCGTTITGALPVCRTDGPGQAQGVYQTQYCGAQQGQAQGIYYTQYCGAQPAQAQGVYYTQACPAQAQAPGPSMFPPQCPTIFPHCGPGNAGGNQPQAAPTQLLGCNTATTPPAQSYTQAVGCNTATPTAHYTHNIPGCTTVTSAPEQAQGWTAVPACTTYAPAPAQAQGFHPTFHVTGGCGPANAAGGGQAQPQMTIPTFPPAVCVVTQLANCTKVTGIPFVC